MVMKFVLELHGSGDVDRMHVTSEGTEASPNSLIRTSGSSRRVSPIFTTRSPSAPRFEITYTYRAADLRSAPAPPDSAYHRST
jgi:hypothetical protein